MSQDYLNRYLPLFHNKRKYLYWYLTGIVDGDGSFSVSFKRHPNLKSGWLVDPVFQVYQHKKHREVLELLKEVFQTGSIYQKSDTHPVMVYGIHSLKTIKEKIIPFFTKYRLIIKQKDFLIFKEIVERMDRKEHLTKEGLKKIHQLALKMNQQGKGRKYLAIE